MTFLAPGFLIASLAAASAVVVLHFIVTRQPRAGILPTARFVPDMPATATARARRPSDILLMLLRVLILLAAGAGLARPVIKPSRGAEARVILADVSRAVGNVAELRDSVRAVFREGDAIVAFDSAARSITGNVADSIGALNLAPRVANVSAALIAALRAGSSMRERADSIELVVVSPFASASIDDATQEIRTLWPGKARIVRISAAAPADTTAPSAGRVIGAASDPLAIAVQLEGSRATIVRDDSGIDISDGNVLVHWPVAARPLRSVARATRDTIGGVMTSDGSLVVSAFERRWSYPADSLRGAQVVARWIDGEPAALEWNEGTGCTRSVAVPVTAVGDLVIRRDFVKFVESQSGSCAGAIAPTPMTPQQLAMIEGSGGLAPREAFRPRADAHSWLAPWLLGLALLGALAELFVRRRKQVAAGKGERVSPPMASAA